MPKPSDADPERLMPKNRRGCSHEPSIPETMKAIRALSDEGDASDALVDHVVSSEHPVEEEHSMSVESSNG